MLVSRTHPKHPQSNFHCTVIELVCTASLISGSNLYPPHLPTPQHLRADSFISLLQYVSPLQERCSEYLNILGTITLSIICNTNDTFPVFYDTSVLCFISLHLVFSLIFFLPSEILQVYCLYCSGEEYILHQKKENDYGNTEKARCWPL